jgi:hypothetical protein
MVSAVSFLECASGITARGSFDSVDDVPGNIGHHTVNNGQGKMDFSRGKSRTIQHHHPIAGRTKLPQVARARKKRSGNGRDDGTACYDNATLIPLLFWADRRLATQLFSV